MAASLEQRGYQYVLDPAGGPRCVGKGSFGHALLVRDGYGQVFVAKELNLSQMSKKDRLSAENEVRLLQQVDHPFIIKFIDSFVDAASKLYIIMEYADGGDLAGRIKAQRRRRVHFTERQVMVWFTMLCLALDHLHEKKILHRDLKTTNVFLTSNNIVKLGDFGFSKRLKTAAMAHTVCGTPYYFSPELCQGQPYSNKSDIWSLGVILYEMAMLARPYEADSIQELMKRIVFGQYTPVDPDCPVRVGRLIFYMLAKKDTARPSVTKLLLNAYVQSYVAEMPKFLRVTGEDSRYPKSVGEESSDSAPEDATDADPGGHPHDREPLRESQACTREEMQALAHQLHALPLPPPPAPAAAAPAAAPDPSSSPSPSPPPQNVDPGAPAPKTPPKDAKEVSPSKEHSAEENDVFEDKYESDFEEYEGEADAEASQKRVIQHNTLREHLEAELGVERFVTACRILQEMGDDEAAATADRKSVV